MDKLNNTRADRNGDCHFANNTDCIASNIPANRECTADGGNGCRNNRDHLGFRELQFGPTHTHAKETSRGRMDGRSTRDADQDSRGRESSGLRPDDRSFAVAAIRQPAAPVEWDFGKTMSVGRSATASPKGGPVRFAANGLDETVRSDFPKMHEWQAVWQAASLQWTVRNLRTLTRALRVAALVSDEPMRRCSERDWATEPSVKRQVLMEMAFLRARPWQAEIVLVLAAPPTWGEPPCVGRKSQGPTRQARRRPNSSVE